VVGTRRVPHFVVRWFAGTVQDAGRAQGELIAAVEALNRQWRERLKERHGRAVRSDASAWQVLELLPPYVVLTSQVVAKELGLTLKAAKAALDQLAEADVVLEYGSLAHRRRGRPATIYVSTELLGLTGSSPMG
jgi:hypothetical protein